MYIKTTLDNLIWQSKRNRDAQVGAWHSHWDWHTLTGVVWREGYGVVLEVSEKPCRKDGRLVHYFNHCEFAHLFPDQVRRIVRGQV